MSKIKLVTLIVWICVGVSIITLSMTKWAPMLALAGTAGIALMGVIASVWLIAGLLTFA